MPRRNRDSKQLLARAARAEFARHGFAGARTDRIAKRAGVNKQLVFYYFGSKAGLYEAVVRGAEAQLAAAVPGGDAGPPHAAARLRLKLQTIYQTLTRHPELTRLLIQGVQEHPRGVALPDRAIRTLIREVATVISQGQGSGYFRDDVDPEQAARQGVVLLLGYLALQSGLAAGEPESHRAAWLDGVADLLVRSLSW